jgi:LPS sulfotransferase NodH
VIKKQQVAVGTMDDLFARIQRSLRKRAAGALGVKPATVELTPMTPSELEEIKQFFGRPKFFIMGYPRSGTTLLARLIRLAPDVSCRWQGHFASGPGDWLDRLGRPEIAEWLQLRSNRWTAEGQPSLTALARLSADYFMERVADQEGSRWVGDKTPTARMDLAVDRLQRLYPDAHVLAIVRDGRDAALSQRIQAFIDQPDTLSLGDVRLRQAIEANPEDFGPEGRSLFSKGWLERVASDWSLSTGRGHQLASRVFAERYLSLRYEDLLADPTTEISRLWRFLGVTVEADVLSAVEGAMARNPAAEWHQQAAPDLARHLKRGTAGGWSDWFTPADLDLFHAVAGQPLSDWGYRT